MQHDKVKAKVKVIPAVRALREQARKGRNRNVLIRFPGKSGRVGRPRRSPDLLGSM